MYFVSIWRISSSGAINAWVSGGAAIGYTYGGRGDYFMVPDLRGVFLRGLDRGRRQDSDPNRYLGSYQADSNKSHSHNVARNGSHSHNFALGQRFTVQTPVRGIGRGVSGIPASGGWSIPPHHRYENSHWLVIAAGGEHSHALTESGRAEARPKNVAVNFIIKY